MHKTLKLALLGLALVLSVSGAADACGWRFTCDTQGWLHDEVLSGLPLP